jgi:hypothetical protein
LVSIVCGKIRIWKCTRAVASRSEMSPGAAPASLGAWRFQIGGLASPSVAALADRLCPSCEMTHHAAYLPFPVTVSRAPADGLILPHD